MQHITVMLSVLRRIFKVIEVTGVYVGMRPPVVGCIKGDKKLV